MFLSIELILLINFINDLIEFEMFSLLQLLSAYEILFIAIMHLLILVIIRCFQF